MKHALLIFLLMSFFAGAIHGQVATRSDREIRLQQLDKQIEIARDLLRQFPNSRASQLLKLAVVNRTEAIALFGKNRRALAAMRLNTAFSLVSQALNLLSVVPLERIKEQVHELLVNAEQALGVARNKEAERLLKDAKSSLKIANREMSKGNSLAAIENFRVARFLLERVIGLVNLNRDNLQDQLRNEKERYEELLHRAEEIVGNCDDKRAKKILDEANKQYRILRQAIAQGNNKIALNLYYSTTRLLLRAIDMCQGIRFSASEQAKEELQLLQDLVSSAVEEKRLQGPRNKLILQKVRNLQRQARNSIKQGQYQMALRRIELARNLVGGLLGRAEGLDLTKRSQQELQRLENDISRQSAVGARKSGRVNAYLRAAEQSARDARRFLNQNQPHLALESILAGHRFLSAMRNRPERLEWSAEQLNQELRRLSSRIEQLKANKADQGRGYLELAQQMLARAETAAGRQNFNLAYEYSQMVQIILDKAAPRENERR